MNGQKNTRFDITMEVSLETMLRDEDLAALREAGITYLAVPFEFYDLEESVIARRFQSLTAMGFKLDTCHPPFGGGNEPYSLCAEDEDVRRATIKTYQHYLRAFSTTGMRVIPVHTGGAMHSLSGVKALARLTDTLEQLLPEAKKSNVIMALENTFYGNPCPFTDAHNPSGINEKRINDDCAMLRAYVTGWREPLIRVCHDVGHSMLFGHNLAQDLEQLAPLTALYHIHDNDGARDMHWNVGEGVFPWKTLVDSLVARGYSLPLYDEILREKDPAMQPQIKLPARVIKHFEQTNAVLRANL